MPEPPARRGGKKNRSDERRKNALVGGRFDFVPITGLRSAVLPLKFPCRTRLPKLKKSWGVPTLRNSEPVAFLTENLRKAAPSPPRRGLGEAPSAGRGKPAGLPQAER